MTDVLIYTSASIAAIMGILCGLFYGDHKTPAIWLMFGCVVFSAFAACLFWQQKVTPEPETAPDAIRVKIGAAFISERQAAFFVKRPFGSAEALSPIRIALGVTLTNTRSVPVTLDSLSMSVRNGNKGKWEELTSISVGDFKTYFIPSDFKQAKLVKFLGTVDTALRGSPLAPNVPVRGWMFFEYPVTFANFAKGGNDFHWKFNAEDTAGNKYEAPVVIPTADRKGLQFDAQGIFSDGTTEDVSMYPVIPFREPEPE